VVSRAEDLPFADGSCDCVVSRIAPHHFADVRHAVEEMARVSNDVVVIEDTLFSSDRHEQAEKLRDPTHVRNYTEDEWVEFLARGHAPPGPVLSRARAYQPERSLRPCLAWCSRPRHPPMSPGEPLMAIIVDNDTKLVVQGATGREGSFHTLRNRDYGTNVVAGVTPGKGGQDLDGIPIFDTVAEAVEETGANTSMVFVPARFAADAIYEDVDAGIETVTCLAGG